MSVFVYNNTGLLEERPETERKEVGQEVYQYNEQNPETKRKLLVDESFPPVGQVFDISLGALRKKTLREKVDAGEMTLPEGYSVQAGPGGDVLVAPDQKLNADGQLVEKTLQEKIDAGLVSFDPHTQKVVNDEIVSKSSQELLEQGDLTLEQVLERNLQRLRTEIVTYFATTKTPTGYRLDELARQKAAFSYQFYALADTDPIKADLLNRKLIYTNVIIDEIMSEIEKIQNAYDKAVLVVKAAFEGSNDVSVFESVKIENYIA